jgi:hypothetical protein
VLGDRSGTDGVRNRFSRTFSLYDDPDTRSQISSIAKKEESSKEATSTYSNGYSRYSSRIKDDSPPPSRASGRLSRATSPVVVKEREKSPTVTSSYTYRSKEPMGVTPAHLPKPRMKKVALGLDLADTPLIRTELRKRRVQRRKQLVGRAVFATSGILAS